MADNIIGEIPKNKLAEFVDCLPSYEQTDFELEIVGQHQLQDSFQAPKEVVLVQGDDVSKLEGDFEQVRHNLANIAAKSDLIVDELLMLARQSESPRAYEVLTTAINTLVGVNKDLLDTHMKRADIKKKMNISSAPENQTNVQNNNVFVGSSKEMLELLRK